MFTTNSESFTKDLDKLVNLDQFSDIFDDWKDLKNLKGLLPNGIQSFLQDKGVNTQDDGFNGSAESFSVGLRLENLKNFTADHNVVMVPWGDFYWVRILGDHHYGGLSINWSFPEKIMGIILYVKNYGFR